MANLIRIKLIMISVIASILGASALFGITNEEIKTNSFMRTNPPVFFKTSVPNTKLILLNAKSLEFGGIKAVPGQILPGFEFIGFAPDKSNDTFEFRLRNQGLLKTVRIFAIQRDEKTRIYEHEDYEIKVEFSKMKKSVLYGGQSAIEVYVIDVVSITKMKPSSGGTPNTDDEKKMNRDNNILRQWIVVALKTDKLATSFQKEGIAVDNNGKPFEVGTQKENIKLMFSGNTNTKPAKFEYQGYSVASLTPDLNPGQIEIQIGAFSKIYQIPKASGIVSDTIQLSDGQYEIKINFKKEKGTWMLFPKGKDLTPADAYLISIESITKVVDTKTDQIIKDIKAQQTIAEAAQKTAETTKNVADAEKAATTARDAVANARKLALQIPNNQEAANSIKQAENALANADAAVKKLTDEIIRDIKAQQTIAENGQKTAEAAKTVADAEKAVTLARGAVANAQKLAFQIPNNQEAANSVKQAEGALAKADAAVKKLRDAQQKPAATPTEKTNREKLVDAFNQYINR